MALISSLGCVTWQCGSPARSNYLSLGSCAQHSSKIPQTHMLLPFRVFKLTSGQEFFISPANYTFPSSNENQRFSSLELHLGPVCLHSSSNNLAAKPSADCSRRVLLTLVLGACMSQALTDHQALASTREYRQYVDRFDGYTFSYPAEWIQVRGAGADVFFRDPVNLDENVLVEVSSPSSSKFKGVGDLGTPDQAAKKVLQQYLTEFMSTRIGVRRESNIVATNSRVGDDGRLYYEVEVNVSSYANENQLAVMPQDRVVQLEWSRRYLLVLGVENHRLYQLRLQVPERFMEREERDLRQIMDSFRVTKLLA